METTKPVKPAAEAEGRHGWTFLTNHSHVLICLAARPDSVLRDVANQVGITERAVQRIVAELEEAGYVERHKTGRQNTYKLNLDRPLRHAVEGHCSIGGLIRFVTGIKA